MAIDIKAFDDRVLIESTTPVLKESYPHNKFRARLQKDNILIEEVSGNASVPLPISKISDVSSIEDTRTGGPGVIAVPATLALLFDIIDPFFFA